MKRIFVVAAIVALVVSVPATASAQESPRGCKEYGEAVALVASGIHPFGELIKEQAPVDELVAFNQAFLCVG
jgi:hypothetical protein